MLLLNGKNDQLKSNCFFNSNYLRIIIILPLRGCGKENANTIPTCSLWKPIQNINKQKEGKKEGEKEGSKEGN